MRLHLASCTHIPAQLSAHSFAQSHTPSLAGACAGGDGGPGPSTAPRPAPAAAGVAAASQSDAGQPSLLLEQRASIVEQLKRWRQSSDEDNQGIEGTHLLLQASPAQHQVGARLGRR